jgi:putative sterol carrier protein
MSQEWKAGQTMDATAEFFNDLGQREHEPLLEKVTGTLRFDLEQGERTDHCFVAVNKGDVVVSDTNADADLVVRAGRTVFDGIVSGKTNAMSATLRGELAFQGDPQLFLRFQRLFPGPPNSHDPGGGADKQRRSRS